MSNETPIGTVCPFAGQVNPVSSSANSVWSDSGCGSNDAQPGTLADDASLNYLEAQGWMPCDGSWLGSDTYPELFAVLGHLYGKKTDNDNVRGMARAMSRLAQNPALAAELGQNGREHVVRHHRMSIAIQGLTAILADVCSGQKTEFSASRQQV